MRSFLHPMTIQCFAFLHISERSKILQGHWTEQQKEQMDGELKYTPGQWYFSHQLLIQCILNYLEYVLGLFLISAYMPILVCKQAILTCIFDVFSLIFSLIFWKLNSRLRWYITSSIVNRTRSATFSKYLLVLWK